MSRNIARAKQQFSEVIRLAAEAPQMIYNRDRCVAAVVDAESFKAFDAWRKQSARKTLGEEFAELRQIGGRSPLRRLTHCRRYRVRRSIARMPSLPCWKTARIARSQADMFIAATAQVHALTLVTRNAADFAGCGIPVLNPFSV